MRKCFTLRSAMHDPTIYAVMVSLLLLLVVAGCGSATSTTSSNRTGTATSGGTPITPGSGTPTRVSAATSTARPPRTLPHFDHIVVAIEENRGYSEIIGSGSTPYINALASQGALFTNSHATQHPSEPNYLSLFAGSTFGLTDDSCPTDVNVSGPNLGGELIAKSDTFAGYSDSMPGVGFTGCSSHDGLYAANTTPG